MFQEECFISAHEMGTGKGLLNSVNTKKWGSDRIAITLNIQSNKQNCTCLGQHDYEILSSTESKEKMCSFLFASLQIK